MPSTWDLGFQVPEATRCSKLGECRGVQGLPLDLSQMLLCGMQITQGALWRAPETCKMSFTARGARVVECLPRVSSDELKVCGTHSKFKTKCSRCVANTRGIR